MGEVPVIINDCFEKVNAFRGRYRVLFGGACSGKSQNVATDYLLKLVDPENTGANLLVVRRNLHSHLYSCFATLTNTIDQMGVNEQFIIQKNKMSIYCKKTGNSILFMGMDQELPQNILKTIKFPNGWLTWIWCEEATELSAQDFEILDDRLRGHIPQHLYYQITLTFNPVSSQHWLKKRFFLQKAGADTFLHHSTYQDNPFIDEEFHRRMERRREYDPEGYRTYALGEWGDNEATY